MSEAAPSLLGRLGGWFSPAASAEIAAAEDAALRSDRFRLEREGEWKRLEAIVTRIEKGRLRGISDEDLLALPALYRTAVSSLAVARETSLDAETLEWLEGLTRRAWFIVYGPRAGLGDWLMRFFGGGWGESVRALKQDILIAFALMVAGTPSLEPRLADVPVRLPLPPADKQGSIYENQKGLKNRFFDVVKAAAE